MKRRAAWRLPPALTIPSPTRCRPCRCIHLHRNACAKEDLYYPHPLIQDVLWWTLYQAEPLLLGSRLRNRALKECMKHIHYEVGPAEMKLPARPSLTPPFPSVAAVLLRWEGSLGPTSASAAAAAAPAAATGAPSPVPNAIN